MSLFEFLNLIQNETLLHSIAFVIIFALLCLLFRKHIFTVFDPLLFSLLMTSASILCVVSLFYYRIISLQIFAIFILLKLSIFVGVTSHRSIKNRLGNYWSRNKHIREIAGIEIVALKLFFMLSIIAYAFVTIYLYSKLGLLILKPGMSSTYFMDYGVLIRLKGFFAPMVIMNILIFAVVFHKHTTFKWLAYFALLLVMSDGVISASKSNFVHIVLYWGLLLFYLAVKGYVDNQNAKKVLKVLGVLSLFSVIAFVLVVVAKTMASEQDFAETGLISIIGAFIARGDIYLYLLPGFDQIQREFGSISIFNIFFAPVLAVFRLLDTGSVVNLPSFIMEYSLGYDPQGQGVPNARLTSILMLLCNVPVGMLIGYFVGSCISFIRNEFITILPNSIFSIIYVTYLGYKAPDMFTDIGDTIMQIGLNTVLFLVFFIISHILASSCSPSTKPAAAGLI